MPSTERGGDGELTTEGRCLSCDPAFTCWLTLLTLPFYLVLTQILSQAFITLLICVAYDNLICMLVTVVVCWEGEAAVKSASINQDQKVSDFMREIWMLWKLIGYLISQWKRWRTQFACENVPRLLCLFTSSAAPVTLDWHAHMFEGKCNTNSANY